MKYELTILNGRINVYRERVPPTSAGRRLVSSQYSGVTLH